MDYSCLPSIEVHNTFYSILCTLHAMSNHSLFMTDDIHM